MKIVSGKSNMVRQANRDLIRTALRDNDGSTVAGLARKINLSVATCSRLVTELVESGEAVELPSESQGGRPARRYAYNVDYSLAAIIMLIAAGDSVEIRYSIKNGADVSLANEVELHPGFTVEDLDKLLSRLVDQYPTIKAVALSVPGVVHEGEILNSVIPVLKGMNLERHIADTFGLKVISEKDMNFAAIGFYNRNRANIKTGMVYVTFPSDQCAGMGVIIGGTLLKGMTAFAGEIDVIPPLAPRAGETKGDGECNWLINRIAAITVATVTIVNPDIFVLTGDLITPDLHDPVRNRCLELIQEQHLPRFVFRSRCDDDILIGMTAMALGSLSGEVKLVAKERLWCGPD